MRWPGTSRISVTGLKVFIPAIVYWAIDRKTGVFCNLAIFGTGENKETE